MFDEGRLPHEEMHTRRRFSPDTIKGRFQPGTYDLGTWVHISLLADGLYRRLAVRNCDTGYNYRCLGTCVNNESIQQQVTSRGRLWYARKRETGIGTEDSPHPAPRKRNAEQAPDTKRDRNRRREGRQYSHRKGGKERNRHRGKAGIVDAVRRGTDAERRLRGGGNSHREGGKERNRHRGERPRKGIDTEGRRSSRLCRRLAFILKI